MKLDEAAIVNLQQENAKNSLEIWEMRRELARAKSALAKHKLSLASDKKKSQISIVKQKLVGEEDRDYFSEEGDMTDNELSLLEF